MEYIGQFQLGISEEISMVASDYAQNDLSVEIKEYYSVKPYFGPKASVKRLLKGIPKKYLSGLATVVLRDSGSLNHNRGTAV